jgi:DNA-binding XRE family transcriptional regulator
MNRVREARLKSHLSQDELADRSGLARPTISKIERGETVPSGLSRQKIADALGRSITEIFPGENADTPLGPVGMSNVMGIAVVNGTMAAAGVRGARAGEVAVREARIEGFLLDHTGKKCPNTLVHLIRDGEKIDSTVSGRQGRFVFKDLEEGEYVLLSEEKFQPVTVSYSDETFEFEI